MLFYAFRVCIAVYLLYPPPPSPYPSQLDEFSALKKYFIKRFTSIYPLYLTIYLSSCILFNNLALADTLVIVPIQLTLTQSNFYMLNVVGNDATWFFSCLAISYFFFPFISHISKHISRKTQIIVLAVIYILLTISPYVMIRFMLVGIYTNPFFRGLEFVFGILLANLFIQAN
ncbi:MAG: acyltransferase family protein, partial [Oscillospiraceae bacterium]